MGILPTLAICLVALLHLLFLVLEMFLWTKPFGRKTFGLSEEFAAESATLAANQGLYNGLFAVCLLWGVYCGEPAAEFVLVLLGCIIVAGCYGAWSAKGSIFWLQAFPAIIAIVLILTA